MNIVRKDYHTLETIDLYSSQSIRWGCSPLTHFLLANSSSIKVAGKSLPRKEQYDGIVTQRGRTNKENSFFSRQEKEDSLASSHKHL